MYVYTYIGYIIYNHVMAGDHSKIYTVYYDTKNVTILYSAGIQYTVYEI